MENLENTIAKINISLSKVNQLLEKYRKVLPEKVIESMKNRLLNIVKQLIEIYNKREQLLQSESLGREYLEKIEAESNALFKELCEELSLKPETVREPEVPEIKYAEFLNNLSKGILDMIKEAIEKGKSSEKTFRLLLRGSSVGGPVELLLDIIAKIGLSEDEDDEGYESTLKKIFPECPQEDIELLNRLLGVLIDLAG